jgi:hypothetical protein
MDAGLGSSSLSRGGSGGLPETTTITPSLPISTRATSSPAARTAFAARITSVFLNVEGWRIGLAQFDATSPFYALSLFLSVHTGPYFRSHFVPDWRGPIAEIVRVARQRFLRAPDYIITNALPALVAEDGRSPERRKFIPRCLGTDMVPPLPSICTRRLVTFIRSDDIVAGTLQIDIGTPRNGFVKERCYRPERSVLGSGDLGL